MVIERIGGLWSKRLDQAEDMLETVIDPHLRRRSPQQMVVFSKQMPDFAAIGLSRAAIGTRHTKPLQRNAL